MKKIFTVLTLGVLATGTVNAQIPRSGTGSDGNAVSGDIQNPGSIHIDLKWLADAGEFLAKRIHSVEVSQVINQMNADGKRTGNGSLTISGAALYDSDSIMYQQHDTKNLGRNIGFQVLPFTVSILDDGRKFINVSAIAWKNMIGTQDAYRQTRKFFNGLDIVTFEYDERLTYSNLSSMKVKLARVNYKFGLVESNNKKQYLAFTIDASAGVIFNNKLNQEYNLKENEFSNSVAGKNLEYKAGLEYNVKIGKKSNLNISSTASGLYSKQNSSVYTFDNKGEKVYVQLEKNDTFANTVNVHTNLYLNNNITYSKRVSKDGAKEPKRLSIGVKVSTPLMLDKMQLGFSQTDLDMSQFRQMGEIKIGFHF